MSSADGEGGTAVAGVSLGEDATAATASHATVPLVVDVDGTLLRTDLLVESYLALVASAPLAALNVLPTLRSGKAEFKAAIADQVTLDCQSLPYNDAVMEMIAQASDDGREVYLASASDARYVEAVAGHVGEVAGVFGSTRGTNLAGHRKAAKLVEVFGERGFDYAGDAEVDRPVWAKARRAIVVGNSGRLADQARAANEDVTTVPSPVSGIRTYLKAVRPHQWLKNILVFLAPIAGHHFSGSVILAALAAFLAFGFCASSAYLLNDLLDLKGDRQHPTKRHRPFASGALPLVHGAALSPLLLLLGLLLAAAVSWWLLGVVVLYVVSTLLYSLWLKRRPLVDVMMLGGLFTLRVLAGGVATGIVLSPWLLMFSLFLFLCLGIVKRYAELVELLKREMQSTPGRGYHVDDLRVLVPLAVAAGYSAVMVVAFYINSDAVVVLYAQPEVLWLICPLLLYWVSRVIMITHHGHMHDDPVVFALTDRVSILVGIISVGVLLAAGPM